MANKVLVIKEEKEIDKYIQDIKAAIKSTTTILRELMRNSPEDVFYKMKFERIGVDPLENENINLIEQLNQTYTYLVSLYGTKELVRNYPNESPYILHLGTTNGYDIQSQSGNIICECFSSTSLRSNDKLNKEAKRLLQNKNASKRFVFYFTNDDTGIEYYKSKYPEVEFRKVQLS